MKKLGGPCEICGLPQFERKDKCPKSRAECPYGRVDAPTVTTTRFARMLRLYIATTEGYSSRRLSEETGVSESTISRFLSGQQLPDAAGFAALLSWVLGAKLP